MARRKQRNELIAGTFIAVTVVLIVAVLLALADWRSLFDAKHEIRLIFANQSIKGLKSGGVVQYQGKQVGKVRRIEFDYLKPHQIEAVIEVPARLRLYANAPLTIGTGALGGNPWIEISGTGGEHGFVITPPADAGLPPCYLASQPEMGPVLPAATVPLADLDHPIYGSESPNQLIADMGFGVEQRKQLQVAMLAITQVAVTLNDMLGQIQSSMMPKVEGTLTDIQKISGSGVQLMTALNTKLPDVVDRVDHTVSDVHDTIEKISPQIAEAVKRINSITGTLDDGTRQQLANVEAAMKQLNAVLGEAQAAMGNIRQSTETVRDVLSANRDTLTDTMANLQEGSSQLAAGLGEIRREPWRLLYTPKPGEERASNVLAAARAYAEGAKSLRDATTRLTALVADRGAALKTDDPAYRKLLADMTTSQEKFDKAERTLYELLNEKK